MTHPSKRLIDVIFEHRRKSIASKKCMPPPIGCGGPAETFNDPLSIQEYYISGLCQKCQDKVFNPPDEEDPNLDIDPDRINKTLHSDSTNRAD